jgi:hypothetical protein
MKIFSQDNQLRKDEIIVTTFSIISLILGIILILTGCIVGGHLGNLIIVSGVELLAISIIIGFVCIIHFSLVIGGKK